MATVGDHKTVTSERSNNNAAQKSVWGGVVFLYYFENVPLTVCCRDVY